MADVAWAIETYVRTSGDEAFLDAGGGEVTAEAARFFLTRAIETPRGFEIHDVIGPDELHEQVQNSGFTNSMAAWTLRRAADLADAGRGPPSRTSRRAGGSRRQDGRASHPGRPDRAARGVPVAAAPARRAGGPRRARMAARPMEWRDVKQADVVMLMAAARAAVRRGRASGRLPPVRAADPPPVVALRGGPLAGRPPASAWTASRRLPPPRDRDRPRRQPRQPRRRAAHGDPGRAVAGRRARLRRRPGAGRRLVPARAAPSAPLGAPAVPVDPPGDAAHRHGLGRRAHWSRRPRVRRDHRARMVGRGAGRRAAPASRSAGGWRAAAPDIYSFFTNPRLITADEGRYEDGSARDCAGRRGGGPDGCCGAGHKLQLHGGWDCFGRSTRADVARPPPDRDLSMVCGQQPRRHSHDMMWHGYFAHTSPTGSTLTQRVMTSGFVTYGPWWAGRRSPGACGSCGASDQGRPGLAEQPRAPRHHPLLALSPGRHRPGLRHVPRPPRRIGVDPWTGATARPMANTGVRPRIGPHCTFVTPARDTRRVRPARRPLVFAATVTAA